MKSRKAKFLLNAVLVTAVALAFIMPSTALVTNDQSGITIPEGAIEQPIVGKTLIQNINKPSHQTLSAGDDVPISPIEGDDRLPSLTVDQNNHVIISWTNELTFTETSFGLSYALNPTDPDEWLNNGVIWTFSDPNCMNFDTGFINTDGYTGLFGVYQAYTEEANGFYKLPDITNSDALEAYTWQSEAAEPEYAEMVDHDYLHAGTYYPDILGVHNFYVFHLMDMGFDIPQCPQLFRTDVDLDGGVGFFDAQENEDTAPASFCDYYVKDENTVHMAITNVENNKIIWKKLVMDEEPDIEYTPYQSTIADGTESQLAGNANTVLITFVDGGQVKAIFSDDDGESWETSTIGEGRFPNVCEDNGVFYTAFVKDNNAYFVSSEDGGATWSTPIQVNDVDGSVVDETKCIDIHKGGIAWVDSRNADWDIYYQPLATGPTPRLSIGNIGGGLGVSATIENIGDADATNVQWTIAADGTVFVGGEKTGNIPTLAPGDTASISSFLLGFGDVSISIDAVSDEGASASASATGNLLLFFLTGLE